MELKDLSFKNAVLSFAVKRNGNKIKFLVLMASP
jgi:hypothetical protein